MLTPQAPAADELAVVFAAVFAGLVVLVVRNGSRRQQVIRARQHQRNLVAVRAVRLRDDAAAGVPGHADGLRNSVSASDHLTDTPKSAAAFRSSAFSVSAAVPVTSKLRHMP